MTNISLEGSDWQNKISNAAQIGGIETSVIDNGAGRGVRIAWINTGTGLRFKVVIDRAMDIADAFYNQHSLAWISQAGITAPQPFADKGIDWIRTFGGGLVVTCGLSHFGGPESDEHGERGLHGLISNIPAEIESIVQPDPVNGKMDMHITGIIRQAQPLGIRLELRRTISATLGESVIRIHDEVVNRGNFAAPHMLLYHCNFGWPLIDKGTEILWKGEWKPRDGNPNKLFNDSHDFHTCTDVLDDHRGGGEEAAFINAPADENGYCHCGLHNPKIDLSLGLKFKKEQLPWLTNWQHFGPGEYVVGLEPGTNPPIGQSRARKEQQLIELLPGEQKIYDLEIRIFKNRESLLI